MAWRGICDKPLTEPLLTRSTSWHIYTSLGGDGLNIFHKINWTTVIWFITERKWMSSKFFNCSISVIRIYFDAGNFLKLSNYFTKSLSNAIRIPRRQCSKKGFYETTLINWHGSCYSNARKRIPLLLVAKCIWFKFDVPVQKQVCLEVLPWANSMY